jgi:hypothetical protein
MTEPDAKGCEQSSNYWLSPKKMMTPADLNIPDCHEPLQALPDFCWADCAECRRHKSKSLCLESLSLVKIENSFIFELEQKSGQSPARWPSSPSWKLTYLLNTILLQKRTTIWPLAAGGLRVSETWAPGNQGPHLPCPSVPCPSLSELIQQTTDWVICKEQKFWRLKRSRSRCQEF